MGSVPTLEQLAKEVSRGGARLSARQIDAVLTSSSPHARSFAILLRAADMFRDSHEGAVLEYLRRMRSRFKLLDPVLVANILWLYRRAGKEQEAAGECLDFARDALTQGQRDLALEACGAAMILDGMARFELVRDPRAALDVAGLYEQVAQAVSAGTAGQAGGADSKPANSPCGLDYKRQKPPDMPFVVNAVRRVATCESGVETASGRPPTVAAGQAPVPVAMITGNLVDDVVAYSKRVLQFARHLDPARYRLRVYSSENLAVRETPLFPFGIESPGSEVRAPKLMAELRGRGVSTVLLSRHLRFSEAAVHLSRRLEEDGIQIAFFQASLACPIDWLVARLARIPVKIAIHTGCSLFNRGLDATLFDNPANIAREADFWPADAGERITLAKGTDIADLRRGPPLARAELGIPASATVIGVLSNHLQERLSPPYVEVIGNVLRRNASAWFVAYGDVPPEKTTYFNTIGVASRVVWAGCQTRVGAALRMLDIYANEFPVGGSQSVIEAMACGVPVIAMRWSDAHAESAGANSVGKPFAIPGPDIEAYEKLLESWVRTPGARQAAAARLQRRAERRYSIERYVARAMAHAERLLGNAAR
ncbi:MAG: glycosyltransferase [Kiritimatiellae bacterium]|nr:glycosyltransferase [Kiritimatiellia bacterium]